MYAIKRHKGIMEILIKQDCLCWEVEKIFLANIKVLDLKSHNKLPGKYVSYYQFLC